MPDTLVLKRHRDLVGIQRHGDAVQQGLTQDDYSVTGSLLVVGTFAVLQVLVSWLAYRFPRTRPVLQGAPMRDRLTPEEIAEEAPKQRIASLDEVQWGVLETRGALSFIPKKP